MKPYAHETVSLNVRLGEFTDAINNNNNNNSNNNNNVNGIDRVDEDDYTAKMRYREDGLGEINLDGGKHKRAKYSGGEFVPKVSRTNGYLKVLV